MSTNTFSYAGGLISGVQQYQNQLGIQQVQQQQTQMQQQSMLGQARASQDQAISQAQLSQLQQQYSQLALSIGGQSAAQANQPIKTEVKKETRSMFGFKYVREYLDRHKETVMTVGVILFIDYFFLKGALRQRIQRSAERLLSNVEEKLHADQGKAE